MKTIQIIALGLMLMGSQLFAADWEIDKTHSTMNFAVKHLVINTTRGEFMDYAGTVSLDPKDLSTLSANVTVQVASVDTRDEKRDSHLKSADFFDVEKFPTMTFVSKKSVQTAPGMAKLTGDLTIHGVTKEVTFDVEGFNEEITTAWGFIAAGGTAKTSINRLDYGVSWNSTLDAGGVVVGENVKIELELELHRPAK